MLHPTCTFRRILQKVQLEFPQLCELVIESASHAGACALTEPKIAWARLCSLVQGWTLVSLRESGIPLSYYESILGMSDSAIDSLTVNPGDTMEACLQSIEISPHLPNLRELEVVHYMDDRGLLIDDSLISMLSRWNTVGNVARLSQGFSEYRENASYGTTEVRFLISNPHTTNYNGVHVSISSAAA